MKRTLTLIAALLCASFLAFSQDIPSPEAASPSSLGPSAASPEIIALLQEDLTRAGVNTNAYEFDPIVDTKPPRGYKPFYISHYSRHGARANMGDAEYHHVIKRLSKADSLGILTDEGKELLAEARAVLEAYDGRSGRLTPRGEREHRLLADRMYHRFPQVFKKGPGLVRVESSTVHRSLVSMASFVSELAALRPKLRFSIQSDDILMKILANNCSSAQKKEVDRMVKPILKSKVDTTEIMNRLFTDPVKGAEIVGNIDRFERKIWWTACVAENFDLGFNIYKHLPFEVVYKYYDQQNRWIYLTQCNSAEFGEFRMPRTKPLVDEIIRQADDAIATGDVAVDLHFGHDWPAIALASYLGLEGVGDRLSVDEIPLHWFGPKIVSHACNVQIIFYRNRKGNILVKFLMNEKETLLRGLDPVEGPYYDWSVVRENLEGWKR